VILVYIVAAKDCFKDPLVILALQSSCRDGNIFYLVAKVPPREREREIEREREREREREGGFPSRKSNFNLIMSPRLLARSGSK
jgi:hypothetical protein